MIELLIVATLALAVALIIGWALWARPLAGAWAERDGIRAERDAARGEAERFRDADVLSRMRLAEVEATARAREDAHAGQLEQLQTHFAAMAAKALESAQGQFLNRAEARFAEQQTLAETGLKALLSPVAETLGKYAARLTEVEAARNEAYGGLKEQMTALAMAQARVSDEAGRLVTALRSSGKTSGSWGEQQLRNTLEMAGLREGIDFTLQTHVATEERGRRPDAIIKLPGGRQLIIDSKCSLNDYLAATEAASDGDRRAALLRHTAAVRAHAKGLGDKAYWKEFGQAADFVVMFLPGENFLSAALEHDLPLLGWAFDQRVLLAGPINLLAIAKTVALVWRQEKLADEAKQIGLLGAELHASIATMAEHLASVGKNLGQAVGSYNQFVGSLETRVLPRARKFTDMGVEQGRKPVPELGLIEAAVRPSNAPELLLPPAAYAAE